MHPMLALFFANWVVIILVAGIDKLIVNDLLEEKFGDALGVWAFLSFMSVPAVIGWGVYELLMMI